MTKLDVIEAFIRLEYTLTKELEGKATIGERQVYSQFRDSIHSMREVVRKLSRCEMLEREKKE